MSWRNSWCSISKFIQHLHKSVVTINKNMLWTSTKHPRLLIEEIWLLLGNRKLLHHQAGVSLQLMNQMRLVASVWRQLDLTTRKPIDRRTGNSFWQPLVWVNIFLVLFYSKRHSTSRPQMERNSWTVYTIRISYLVSKLIRWDHYKVYLFHALLCYSG